MEQPDPNASSSSPPTTKGVTAEERTMGMLAHLSALAGFVIPFGNIIGPLVIWLIKKDQSAFVDDQGKESLNFQITMMILYVLAGILVILVIGIFLLPLLALISLILLIVAAVKANSGERYRYPFAIRLIQ